MKITSKTTKQELKNILNANSKAVKEADKNLFERIAYTGKKAKEDDSKVSRKDLADLVKEVMNLLGEKLVVPALAEETVKAEPKAEDSVKKLSKGVSKKQKSMEKEVAEEVEANSEETAEVVEEATEEKVDDKKSAKKSKGKKEQPKKDGVIALEGSENQKTIQMAKQFPQTLEVGDVKYELAEDIKTMEDLYNALGNDEEIVFAYYWTKRHLKQFDYFGQLLGQPKSFDNDLDLCTAIYVSDEKKVAYQVSMYTEAFYTILPQHFAEEDGIRVAGGIEYQIYRAV